MSSNGTAKSKKGLLERMRDGVVIGDGGLIAEMEMRGYAHAGIWTPEVCVLHPGAVKELHRELAFSGADVLQALNFYANEKKLREMGITQSVYEINRAALRLVKEVASESDQLVCASLTGSPTYKNTVCREDTTTSLRSELKTIMEDAPDFIMCEWVFDIREMEYVIEVARESGLPVVACMTIGTKGDNRGVSPEECAVRMARAGADVVGTNCAVGPRVALQTIRRMRIALKKAGLETPLIMQPIGIKTPDDGTIMFECCSWPIATEHVALTRFEARSFAREAYNEGVRYIGGCCFFRSYHIKAMAEELAPEKGGRYPAASHRKGWCSEMAVHPHPMVQQRCTPQYWMNLKLPPNETIHLNDSANSYLDKWQQGIDE